MDPACTEVPGLDPVPKQPVRHDRTAPVAHQHLSLEGYRFHFQCGLQVNAVLFGDGFDEPPRSMITIAKHKGKIAEGCEIYFTLGRVDDTRWTDKEQVFPIKWDNLGRVGDNWIVAERGIEVRASDQPPELVG